MKTKLALVLAITVVALTIFITEYQRQAREVAALEKSLRTQNVQFEQLRSESERLQRQKAALERRLAEVEERERLHARNQELERSRTRPNPAVEADASSRPQIPLTTAPKMEPKSFTAAGVTYLQPGETAFTGGWEIESGIRAFIAVFPTMHSGGAVMIDARVFALPDAALEDLGLAGMRTKDRESSQYIAADANLKQELLKRISQTEGSSRLASPGLMVLPGQQATIEVGKADQGFIMGITARPQPNGGFELQLDASLKLGTSQPK